LNVDEIETGSINDRAENNIRERALRGRTNQKSWRRGKLGTNRSYKGL
jgi:hypothetical protein